MNDLIEFLTSEEIIVVYIIAGIACVLCIIVYLVEKNNVKVKQKHNTRELNKLVEEIREETQIEDEPVLYKEPILEIIEEDKPTSVVELLTETDNKNQAIKPVEETKREPIRENIIVEPLSIHEIPLDNKKIDDKEKDKIEYTSVEPDQQTAQLELKKLTEELQKQEELETTQNITLTNYEEQQEEHAIISLEELVKKSKDMYAANELTQYKDEGNEPISLEELENKIGIKKNEYEEPFIIEKVVPKEELMESQEKKSTMKIEDFTKTINSEPKIEEKKFKSSPIISPIYGIERETPKENDMQFENTANYDKLDAEIKKTNEFLMTLKDLQKKLDS